LREQEGALRAVRFMVDGESVRKGPKPLWLDAVGQLEITGLAQGSAVLQIEAPSLAEAVPDRFGPSAQIALFAEPARTVDTTQSAVDFFGSALVSALRGDREVLLADRALLDACASFARVPGERFGRSRSTGSRTHPRRWCFPTRRRSSSCDEETLPRVRCA
jgi:hypothetical protein